MNQIAVLLVAAVLFVSGCTGGQNITTNIIKGSDTLIEETVPLKVAKLSQFDMDNVENHDQYKKFADRMNDLIAILNEQSDSFDMDKLEPSRKTWSKVSKAVTEYGPLIDNYNNVVQSAKEYKNNRIKPQLKQFYINVSKFAFETTVIMQATFAKGAYELTGIAYRASGLNTMAFKCPACVKAALSNTHWAIRTAMVEGSADVAEEAYNITKKLSNTLNPNINFENTADSVDATKFKKLYKGIVDDIPEQMENIKGKATQKFKKYTGKDTGWIQSLTGLLPG